MANEQIYLKMKLFVAKHIRKAKADNFKRYSYDGRKQWQMINKIKTSRPKTRDALAN